MCILPLAWIHLHSIFVFPFSCVCYISIRYHRMGTCRASHAVGCGRSGSSRNRGMRRSESYRNSTRGVIAGAGSPGRHRENRRSHIAPGWFSNGVFFWKQCKRRGGGRRCTGLFLVSNQVTVQIPVSKWNITYRLNRSKLGIIGSLYLDGTERETGFTSTQPSYLSGGWSASDRAATSRSPACHE
jgi:hypothetical protein